MEELAESSINVAWRSSNPEDGGIEIALWFALILLVGNSPPVSIHEQFKRKSLTWIY